MRPSLGRGDRSVANVDVSFATEIPDHLRWKEPVVVSDWHVTSRFKLPKEPPKAPVVAFKPETFPANKSFASIQHRVADRKSSVPQEPQKSPEPPRPAVIPVYAAQELKDHKAMVARNGLAAVTPRYKQGIHKEKEEGQLDPRQAVQARREANKAILQWRAVSTNTRPTTFDELRERNKALLKKKGRTDHYEVKPDLKGKESPIRQFIKHRTPVPHHTTSASYVSPPRRAQSAGPADGSPGRWVPAGGSGGGRWTPRANSPLRTATVREEQIIRAYRAECSELKAPVVPRVASLGPAHFLQQYSLSGSDFYEGGGADAVGSVLAATTSASTASMGPTAASAQRHSPVRQQQQQAATFQPHPSTVSKGSADDVLRGPVTVAVPEGAVVRLHMSGGRTVYTAVAPRPATPTSPRRRQPNSPPRATTPQRH